MMIGDSYDSIFEYLIEKFERIDANLKKTKEKLAEMGD